jgi:hypothetical protein
VTLEPCVHPIKVLTKLVELSNEFIDFEQHWPDAPKVARAVLTCERFVIDGLGAERTMHWRLSQPFAVQDLLELSSASL